MSIGRRIVAEGSVLQRLLDQTVLVGGIYNMGYDECLVLTNDLWKKQAGGIPQHCFLLATAMVPGEAPDPEDEEIILLRVVGPAPLPFESELVEVRAEAMREMILEHGRDTAAQPPAILDVLTRNEIQFSALRAKVLGTFYSKEEGGQERLVFGSDIDTLYSASRYKVYKPFGESLARIVGYPEWTPNEEGRSRSDQQAVTGRITIGTVRYSSTIRRLRRTDGPTTDVPVQVRVSDFVSMKTAVLGMTRKGKSNTMKVIATAVSQYAAETNQNIGQLLFDPAGEYANVNVQDRTALSQIGPEFVTIFRYGHVTQPEVRSLSINFFSDESIEVTWQVISSYLSSTSQAAYVRSFLAANVIGPEDEQTDRGEYYRAQRRRAALYATLLRAGFRPPRGWRTEFLVNAQVLAHVNSIVQNDGGTTFQTARGGVLRVDSDGLLRFWDAIVELLPRVSQRPRQGGRRQVETAQQHTQTTEQQIRDDLQAWLDEDLLAILDMYRGTVGSGYRQLRGLMVFHSPTRDSDYAEEILQELIAGKIVIVDLSQGDEAVVKYLSERVINHILHDAAQRFARGQDPHRIQIYLEEAHRLFERDKFLRPQEADPYVRLAKEAAKYKIGLVYATQEVSSVAPEVLANTSNWIVTHLNNKAEVRELSKYYEFEDFAELTLKAEDVGFARLKTLSGRYIIPIQIRLFDESMIRDAREANLRRLRVREQGT